MKHIISCSDFFFLLSIHNLNLLKCNKQMEYIKYLTPEQTKFRGITMLLTKEYFKIYKKKKIKQNNLLWETQVNTTIYLFMYNII